MREIQVIVYQGEKISIDQLHKATGPECGKAEHWHATAGVAVSLSGKKLPDPGGCGYCKVSDCPVQIESILGPAMP